MKNSFASLRENILTRKFGGTTVGTAEPYLMGYGFSYFDRLPPDLVKYVQQGSSGLSSISEITNILSAACVGVTPPGGTLNNIDFTGIGGIKWGVPGNIDYGTTVSVKYIEFSKTPILDIFNGWFKLIRDYRTGATDLISGDSGEGYSKAKYAGLLYYWTTAPDSQTVETFVCFDGVYPTKDPQDLYSFDIENNSKLEVEIEFHIDTMWREPWVRQKCQNMANTFASVKNIVKSYGERMR